MINYRHNGLLILRNIFFSISMRRNNSLIELLRGVTGWSTWPFFIDASDRRWNKQRLTKLLATKGIKVGGFGYYGGRYMFRVRRGQARYAEQIMIRAGVPVRGRLLTGGQIK